MPDEIKPNFVNAKKRRTFEKFFAQDHVLVVFNSASKGSEVPEDFKNQPALTLKLSRLFRGHTTLHDDYIETNLKFSNIYHTCKIPWSSIWALKTEKEDEVIFEESIPKEIILDYARQNIIQSIKKFLPRKKEHSSTTKSKFHLKRIK